MKTKVLIASLLAVASIVVFLSFRQGISAEAPENANQREGIVQTYDGTGGMLKDKVTGQDVTFVNPQHVEIFQGDDVMYIQIDVPSDQIKNVIVHKVPRNNPN